MSIDRHAKLLLVAALLASSAALAMGDTVGRITGVIREATNKDPLSGATISVAGPTLIGGPRVTQSDNEGLYTVVNLPPGQG